VPLWKQARLPLNGMPVICACCMEKSNPRSGGLGAQRHTKLHEESYSFVQLRVFSWIVIYRTYALTVASRQN
jgi:hypothetical protein